MEKSGERIGSSDGAAARFQLSIYRRVKTVSEIKASSEHLRSINIPPQKDHPVLLTKRKYNLQTVERGFFSMRRHVAIGKNCAEVISTHALTEKACSWDSISFPIVFFGTEKIAENSPSLDPTIACQDQLPFLKTCL